MLVSDCCQAPTMMEELGICPLCREHCEFAYEKPTMEKYGWHEQQRFDDLPSGWMFEGGEEEYYKALKIWEDAQSTCH